jgi:hypothetical protein
MRWIENQDAQYFGEIKNFESVDRPALVFNGERVQSLLSPKGVHLYSLDIIERMAHALAQNQRIDGLTLDSVLRIVEAQCRGYKYL